MVTNSKTLGIGETSITHSSDFVLQFPKNWERNGLPDSEASRAALVPTDKIYPCPLVDGFHDEQGNNVGFAVVHRVLVEHRIHPEPATQQGLMDGLIEVWRTMRFDDFVRYSTASEPSKSPPRMERLKPPNSTRGQHPRTFDAADEA